MLPLVGKLIGLFQNQTGPLYSVSSSILCQLRIGSFKVYRRPIGSFKVCTLSVGSLSCCANFLLALLKCANFLLALIYRANFLLILTVRFLTSYWLYIV